MMGGNRGLVRSHLICCLERMQQMTAVPGGAQRAAGQRAGPGMPRLRTYEAQLSPHAEPDPQSVRVSGKRQGPKARRHAARSPERGKERGRAPAALGERPAAHRLLRDSAQAAPVAAEAGETPDVLDGHIDAGCEREVMAAWIFGCVKPPRDRRVLQTRSRSP